MLLAPRRATRARVCVCRTLSLNYNMLDSADAAAEVVPPLLAAAGVVAALAAALRRPAFGRVSE